MPDIDRIMFDHKELAEALVLKQGIHEGLWGIAVEFGLAAANLPTGPDRTFSPAAINILQKIGIQRFSEASNLTVDAAKINPIRATKTANKKEASKKAAKKK